jgi:hypothetical protein
LQLVNLTLALCPSDGARATPRGGGDNSAVRCRARSSSVQAPGARRGQAGRGSGACGGIRGGGVPKQRVDGHMRRHPGG